MATTSQLSENSHQGFDGLKAALCLASMQVKLNTVSGMPLCLRRNGIGSRSSSKERDAETGLDFFLARYYSGAQGRFLSPDEFKGGPDDAITGKDISQPGPLPYADISNPQSLNKYAYTYNNPLRYTDPDGHGILDWFKDAGCHLGASSFCGHGLSKKGVDFIARHEGFRSQVYLDVAGNPTIGYGHLIKKGEDFSKGITKEQGKELLGKDAQIAVNAVKGKTKTDVTQREFDALTSFTFNVGSGNFGKSTLLKNINAGNEVEEKNFTDWRRAGGKVVPALETRRKEEFHLFDKGDYGD